MSSAGGSTTNRVSTAEIKRSPADLSIAQLNAAFERATLDSPPDARLVLASAGPLKGSHETMIPLPSSVGAWDMFGILQRMHDVNFTICLPVYDPPCDDPSRMIPSQLVCKIYYDPGQNTCLLQNSSIFDINISALGPEATEEVISAGQQAGIHPGLWRITYKSRRFGGTQHLVDFLMMRRKFEVFMHESPPQPLSVAPQKHKIAEDSRQQDTASKRRKRDDNIMEAIFAPATKPVGSAAANSAPAEQNEPQNRPLHLVQFKGAPLLRLQHGDVAIVRNTTSDSKGAGESPSPSPTDYKLTRMNLLGKTNATEVFAGRHSGLSNDIAVKIMRYRGQSWDQLVSCANSFIREKTMLEGLRHPNIMSLRAFDGRIFVLCVEKLPLSLRDARPGPEHAKQILYNISSALAYLGTKGIVHNDIKPGNIAYSPERGAVLLDFGMATRLKADRSVGGTPKYMAPEYWRSGPPSLAGDVWALGVTMLYVLQKVGLPERAARDWNLQKCKAGDPHEQSALKAWLDVVESLREKLRSEDVIENIVYGMLELRLMAASEFQHPKSWQIWATQSRLVRTATRLN